MIVLRNSERMGKGEEEMAVHVKSDKDLNLGFTTAHTLVTLRYSVVLPLPSNFTSNGSRLPNDPGMANHRTLSPWHQ